MPLDRHDPLTAPDTHEAPRLSLERVLTRRRMLAVTGAALAPLLVACGDEEEPEDVPEQVDPPDEPELDPDEPGMDAPDTGLETEEPDEDDEDDD